MQDERKTKKQLVRELRTLRAKLKRLEKSDDDAIGGVQIISQDITERKKADVEIALLAHAIQSIGECVSITDTENKILFANDGFLRTYGYTADELIGKPITVVRSQTTEPGIDEILHATLQGRWQGELVNRKKDGTEFPIALSTSVVRNEKGQPIALVGIAADITERKRAEEQLRQSQELFSSAFHVSPAGITITRIADGKIIDANEAFLDMFEFSGEETIGHTSTELNMLSPEERGRLIQQQLESGGLHNCELLSRAKSGRLVNLLFSSKPLELGGEACHITTMIDITERKQAEDEISMQLEELQRWHALTIGRESRIIEIKREVNELLVRLGETIRYPSEEKDASKEKW